MVEARDFRADQNLVAYVCPVEGLDEAVPQCGEYLAETTAEEDGSARLRFRVPARFDWFPYDVERQPADGSGIPIDCTRRPGRCVLVVTNFYRVLEQVPLNFD